MFCMARMAAVITTTASTNPNRRQNDAAGRTRGPARGFARV